MEKTDRGEVRFWVREQEDEEIGCVWVWIESEQVRMSEVGGCGSG